MSTWWDLAVENVFLSNLFRPPDQSRDISRVFSNRNVQSVGNQDFLLTTMQMMLKILPSHFSWPAEKKLSLLENPERKEGWSAVKCISDITTPSPYISIIEWIEGQNVKRWWCNCWGNHHRHQSVSRKEWWWSWRVSTTCVNNLSYALFAAANQCKQIVIVINTDNKHILDPPSHGRQRAHMFEKVLSSQILGANKTWSFQQLGLQI